MVVVQKITFLHLKKCRGGHAEVFYEREKMLWGGGGLGLYILGA